MAKQIKGKCRCCSKEFARAGMLRHLNSCKERKEAIDQETGKPTGYFELLIASKYMKEYWLMIEIEDTAKLSDLDQFIRDIWVECCGHLSSFNIGGQLYDSMPSSNSFWGPPAKSMHIQLKKVMEVGAQINYEYDFGSTTELLIKVLNHREGKRKNDTITILSRNNSPEIFCSVCQKNLAAWVNPEGFYEDTPYWCEECLESEREEDEEEYEEYILPVCNSPRMGVCGYEGSNRYPE